MCDPLLCAIVDRAMAHPVPTSPAQSCLRSLLIGDPQAVRDRIQALHRAGMTEMSFWSALLPIPHTQEVISVYIERRRQIDIGDRAGQ